MADSHDPQTTRTFHHDAAGSASDAAASTGDGVRGYTVTGEVGRGGMGRVVRATESRLDREVAIKQLVATDAASRARFEREARITARLQHPAIVPVYDAGIDAQGVPYYAMRLVTGRTLADAIQATTTLDQRLGLLRHVIAVAEAVAYAHSQRVIHRDLKASNVIVGEFGETIVIDWGVAKALAGDDEVPEAEPSTPASDDLTTAGAVIGTPAYMPPEQAAGKPVDERVDVYAIGVMLYHLLAGQMPYRGSTSREVLAAVLAGPPPAIGERVTGVPRDLAAIIGRAMARDASDRYPTARELAADLERFASGQLVASHAYTRGELVARWLRRNRAPVVVAAALLIVVIAVAVVSVRNIVRAERTAQQQRDHAEERSLTLMLERARALLPRDPTQAMAALRPYLAAGGDPRAARVIAGDAWTRGVSRRVLRGHQDNVFGVEYVAGDRILSYGADGDMRLWERDSTWRALGPGTPMTATTVTPDRTTVVARDTNGVFWFIPVDGGAPRSFEGDGSPSALPMSRDGRWLAAIGADHRITLIPLDGSAVRTLGDPLPTTSQPDARNPNGHITTADWTPMAWSPDGAWLAVSTRQGVDLWALPAGPARRIAPEPQANVIFSPDGSYLAGIGDDGVVRVWSNAGELVHRFVGHTGTWDPRLEFTADGRFLVTLAQPQPDAGGELYAWDLAAGTGVLLDKTQAQLTCLSVFPTGHRVVTGDSEGSIFLWDVEQGTSRRLAGHEYHLFLVAISPDGTRVASTSVDRTVREWDVVDGAATAYFPGGRPATQGTPAALAPDGSRLVTVRGEATVEVWGLRDGQHHVLAGGPARVDAVAIAPRATSVIAGGPDGELWQWELGAGATARSVGKTTAAIRRLAWSPDGASVASGHADGSVQLWSLTGATARALTGHTGRVSALAYSPDGAWLASGDGDGVIRLWEVATGRPWAVLPGHTKGVLAVAFSPDGRFLASSAIGDSDVRLWRLEAAAAPSERRLSGHVSQIWTLTFSSDSRTLASGGRDHKIRLWSVDGGEPRMLTGHGNVVTSIAFAPDGDHLVSASSDRTARLWDLTSGESRPVPHTGVVWRIGFAGDSRRVVSWGPKDIRVWTDDLPFDRDELLAWIDARTSVQLAE